MASYPVPENPPEYSDKETASYDEKQAIPYSGLAPTNETQPASEVVDATGQRIETHALSQYSFDSDASSRAQRDLRDVEPAYSLQRSARVLIKRYLRTSPTGFAAAQREITALNSIKDDSIPTLFEIIDSGPVNIYLAISDDPGALPIKQYIARYGPLTNDPLKAICAQLMSALASIFAVGLAHLRICDSTLYISGPDTMHLTVTDFQHCYAYGQDKLPSGLYAAADVHYTDDIYVAPEVFSASTQRYNARKATLWSTGVAIYFMATGQTDYLSNIDHPLHAESSRRSSVNGTSTAPEAGKPNPPIPTAPHRRKSSLSAAFHRISHPTNNSNEGSSSSSPNNSNNSRRTSLAPLTNIVTYPGTTRFQVVNWARDIISKMIVPDPSKRAELIEVAAKVPKDAIQGKETRPLMELAWLDYKQHVGPEAGVFGSGGGTAQFGSWGAGGDGASLFGGASTYSQGFGGWLDRRTSATMKAPAYM